MTTGRSPAQNNHFGFDADLFAADGILPHNATSATITVNTAATNGETIYPGVLTFASELLAPKVRPVTAVTDLNGGNAEPGDILEYVTTAPNTGNNGATELEVTSRIPAGVELVDGTLVVVQGGGLAAYDPVTRTITWDLAPGGDTLAPGDQVVVRYRVIVDAPADGASIGIVTGAEYGSDGLADRYTMTGTGGGMVASSPDYALNLTRTPGSLVRGATASYSLSVHNSGSAPGKGLVRVSDMLPAGLAFEGVPAGSGWGCSVLGRDLTCDRGDSLSTGGTYPSITVPVRVRQSSTSNVVNAATVSGAGDGIHGNDSDSDDAGVADANAAVSLELDADPGTLSPGDSGTLTARVSNAGPSDATGVQVALTLPTGLELISAPGCVVSACAVGTVAAGAHADVVYTVRARRGAAGTTQPASASVTSATADLTFGDDSDGADIDVRRLSLVAVTQDVDVNAVAGAPLELRLEVRNDGPTTASGVVLREPLPAALRTVSVTIDPTHGSCTATLGCDLAPLADGARVPIVVRGRVATSAGGDTLDLNAALDPVADDPDHGDDAVSVARVVAGEADLALTTVSAPQQIRAGERKTWKFRVSNGGQGDASGVELALAPPSGLRLIGACCVLGALGAGESRELEVTLAADPERPAGTFTLRPVVSGAEPDPDTADATVDVAGESTREAALSVKQAHVTEQVVAGLPATFTATVTNAGPSTANDVVVTQRIPSGLNDVDISGARCERSGDVLTCHIETLAAGETAVIAVTGKVSPAAGGQRLEPVVSVKADEPDADAADDTASAIATAVAVNDVSVGATAPAGIVDTGQRASVTLNLRNDGPSNASDVVVTQRLPERARVVDLDPRCTLSGRIVTCRIGGLGVGEQANLVIRVVALKPFDGAALASSASVSSAGTDPLAANDSVAADVPLPACRSARKFTIRLRLPKAATLRSVNVRVAGKPVKVRVGKRLTAVVDLRDRPAGRMRVKIKAVTRDGRPIVGVRAYQPCTPKIPMKRPPRI